MACLSIISQFLCASASAMARILSSNGKGSIALHGSGKGANTRSLGKGITEVLVTGGAVPTIIEAVLACPLTQKPIPPAHIVSVEYSEPEVNLSYGRIPSEGGVATPTYSYSQIKATIWSNGKTTTETLNEGATLKWNIPDGIVEADANTFTSELLVKRVTLEVRMNGKSKSVSFNVIQDAYVELSKYFIGAIDSSTADFRNADLSELEEKMYEEGDLLYTATKNCFVVMFPENITFDKIGFADGEEEMEVYTPLSISDFNLVHADEERDGKTYKVYGYRFGAVDADSPLTYQYTLKKI